MIQPIMARDGHFAKKQYVLRRVSEGTEFALCEFNFAKGEVALPASPPRLDLLPTIRVGHPRVGSFGVGDPTPKETDDHYYCWEHNYFI